MARYRFLPVVFALIVSGTLSSCSSASESTPPGGGDAGSVHQWEYRWDDQKQWTQTNRPSNPPGRNERNIVWLRFDMPEEQCTRPALFIQSIDTIARVYADGTAIYSHGDPDTTDGRTFLGWPWHVIDLPPDARTIEFKVYSDYHDIGLWGRLELDEKAKIVERIFRRDLVRISVASTATLLGVFSLLAFFLAQLRSLYLRLFFLMVVFVLRTLVETNLWRSAIPVPLFWDYATGAGDLLLPAAVALFLVSMLTGRQRRIMQFFWWMFLGAAVVAISGALAGLFPLTTIFVPADTLLAIFILSSVIILRRYLREGPTESRILLIGFLAIGIVGITSLLVVYQVLPWTDVFDEVALIIFCLTFTLALAFRIGGVYREITEKDARLRALNASLEEQVRSRTEELEAEKARLEQISITDPLTGLYNRRYMFQRLNESISRAQRHHEPLSVVVIDLDHFKRINDSMGHLYGDTVLQELSGLSGNHLRESDVLCRFGGEEFVIVLPNTDSDGARDVAERIRVSFQERFRSVPALSITLSAGVTTMTMNHPPDAGEILLSEADRAMYEAKVTGRNRTVVFSV